MEFDIKKFAHLARIRLTGKESEKFGKDLGKILNHFKELQEIDTKSVEPMTGGTELKNVFREDKFGEADEASKEVAGQFPESRDGYLKVPKVFN